MEQFWFPPTHVLIAYQTGKEDSHTLWIKLPSVIQKIREMRLRHVSTDREKRQRHVNADPFTKWGIRKTQASLHSHCSLICLIFLSMIPFSWMVLRKSPKTSGEDSKEYPWSLMCHLFLPGSCYHIETWQHWSLQAQNLPFIAWTQHLSPCCLNLVYTLWG